MWRRHASFYVRSLIVLLVAVMSAGEARANDNFPFLSAGGLIGAGRRGDSGAMVGVELSGGWFGTIANKSDDGSKGRDGFHFEPPFWVGGYGDVVYDFGTETGRVTFGPEIGCLIFGLDGGLVRELGGTGRWGLAIRPSITFPVSLKPPMTLSLYARVERWNGSGDEPSDVEVGLGVKYVLPFTR
jgi:hypothetical protein